MPSETRCRETRGHVQFGDGDDNVVEMTYKSLGLRLYVLNAAPEYFQNNNL